MPTNHNYLALRGADVDDKELQEQYPQIPDEALYTKKLNDIMLDITFNNNIEAGQTEEEATTGPTEEAGREEEEEAAETTGCYGPC